MNLPVFPPWNLIRDLWPLGLLYLETRSKSRNVPLITLLLASADPHRTWGGALLRSREPRLVGKTSLG